MKDIQCKVVLEQRYILGKSFKEIAVFMRISMSWVYKVHTRAIKQVTKYVKKYKKYTCL